MTRIYSLLGMQVTDESTATNEANEGSIQQEEQKKQVESDEEEDNMIEQENEAGGRGSKEGNTSDS